MRAGTGREVVKAKGMGRLVEGKKDEPSVLDSGKTVGVVVNSNC